MASNALSSLELLGPCGRLSVLVAESNRLRQLPEGLAELAPRLQTLDYGNNELKELPPELGQSELKRLCFVGNPLRSIRASDCT